MKSLPPPEPPINGKPTPFPMPSTAARAIFCDSLLTVLANGVWTIKLEPVAATVAIAAVVAGGGGGCAALRR